MATLFTQIINGTIPGRFIYRSDDVVAFLTIEPITTGHVLVVPVREVDHWIDLDPDELSRVMAVSHLVGEAIDAVYSPEKVGMMIAGLEVPHVHVHVLPINALGDLSFANADTEADPASLDAAAAAITEAIEDLSS